MGPEKCGVKATLLPQGLAEEVGVAQRGRPGHLQHQPASSPRGQAVVGLTPCCPSSQEEWPRLSLPSSLDPSCIYRPRSVDRMLGCQEGCFIMMMILNKLYLLARYQLTKSGEIIGAKPSESSRCEHTQFKKQDIQESGSSQPCSPPSPSLLPQSATSQSIII